MGLLQGLGEKRCEVEQCFMCSHGLGINRFVKSPGGGLPTRVDAPRRGVRTIGELPRFLLVVCLSVFSCTPATAALDSDQFAEARHGAGALAIDDTGETWGASWGDYDGDGWPDVYMSKHQYTPPALFRNNRDGSFTNVINRADPVNSVIQNWDTHIRDDTHGAAWADFDDDGDEDLLEVSGGGAGAAATSPTIKDEWRNNLYVNSGGLLIESAQTYSIDYPKARSRTPTWFDYDGDGRLDVVISALKTNSVQLPPAVFGQTVSGFVDRTLETGFSAPSCYYAMLSDLSGDGNLDLICGDASRIMAAYDVSSVPFGDLRPSIGDALFQVWPVDVAIADFTGDLRPDVFVASQASSTSMAVQVGSSRIHATLNQGPARGFTFQSAGDIQLEFGWSTRRQHIFLGAGAITPPKETNPGLLTPDQNPNYVQLQLSTANPQYLGLPATLTAGIYIGYVSGRWEVRAVNAPTTVHLVVRSPNISSLQAVGDVRLDQGSLKTPAFLRNDGGTLVRVLAKDAFEDPVGAISNYATSVVSGDFDNDMDVDVYVGCSGPVANCPNQLFENLGKGKFKLVTNAGGAMGGVLGLTDTVTTVDYDQNGFLDLFVTQGQFHAPFSYSGAQQLFRNKGNTNHWIELDLIGDRGSNPHGIGAIVYASTPDGKIQVREQSNGMHRHAQSHRRLHFGLGANSKVDLQVRWPSGIVDELVGCEVDQIYTLVEGGGGQCGPKTVACGVPSYSSASDTGVVLYYDCGSEQQWHVRMAAGGVAVAYQGRVTSTKPFAQLTGFSQEATDVLQLDASHKVISYTQRVGGTGQDGFDLSFPAGSDVWLDSPTTYPIWVGKDRMEMKSPVNLTPGGCRT